MKRGTLLKRIERLKVKPDQELGGEQGGGMDPGSGAGVTTSGSAQDRAQSESTSL